MDDFRDFGPVYYHPDSVANILCFYDLCQRYSVIFNNTLNQFEVTTDDGSTLIFQPKGKLYVHRAVTLKDATALVETVEENMKGLTQ